MVLINQAPVAELVDATDLKSVDLYGRGSSSLPGGTTNFRKKFEQFSYNYVILSIWFCSN